MSVQFQIYSPKPSPAAPGTAIRIIRWRLVASNNRAMAGSVQDFPDLASARHDIDLVVPALPTAETRLAIAPDDRWRWTLLVEEVPVAVSLRTYTRRLECEQSVASVLRLAPLAERSDVLRVFGEHRGRLLGQGPWPPEVFEMAPPPSGPRRSGRGGLPGDSATAPRRQFPSWDHSRQAPIAPTSRERRVVPR